MKPCQIIPSFPVSIFFPSVKVLTCLIGNKKKALVQCPHDLPTPTLLRTGLYYKCQKNYNKRNPSMFVYLFCYLSLISSNGIYIKTFQEQ